MPPLNTMAHFEDLIVPEPNSGCFLWIGGIDGHGYGQFRWNKKLVGAHRLAYELAKGPIPDGLEPDHICKNPQCVNANHLEAVTPAENKRRKYTGFDRNGHPWTGKTRSGKLYCHICQRTRGARMI